MFVVMTGGAAGLFGNRRKLFVGTPRSLDLWLCVGCTGTALEGKGKHFRSSRIDGAALVGGLEDHLRCATLWHLVSRGILRF